MYLIYFLSTSILHCSYIMLLPHYCYSSQMTLQRFSLVIHISLNLIILLILRHFLDSIIQNQHSIYHTKLIYLFRGVSYKKGSKMRPSQGNRTEERQVNASIRHPGEINLDRNRTMNMITCLIYVVL